MSQLFVSHAVADRHLAGLVVDFLVDAIGVPNNEIFCSSLSGFGTPLTHDFNVDMRERLQNTKLVVLLMTPAYMDSLFCMMELGSTWGSALKPLPIIVPPVDFGQVARTLGLKQSWNINDHKKLQEVRETVLNALGIKGHDNHTFDRKRDLWTASLPKALKKLVASPKVARVDYEQSETRRKALETQLAEEQAVNDKMAQKLDAVKAFQPSALIIESEPMAALDLEILLEGQGFKVVGIARTESEAVDLATRLRPDIVTSEIVLADGSSGIDAVATIAPATGAYPIFITAFPERLLTSKRPEPAHLITKPFDPADVVEKILDAYASVARHRVRQAKDVPSGRVKD